MADGSSASRPSRREERNVPPSLQGLVSRVLRTGVVLSAALLLLGVVLEATVGRGSLLATPAPSSGGEFAALFQRGGAAALVLLGVLVLTATPLARVAISTTLFSAARDRTFAMITLFVLAILGATIVVGVLR
jgi:uncharacterized membrane protein